MTIRLVGVVGLGTMGAGIAQVCAHAGFAVVGRELTPELGDAARGRIAGLLARGVEKGRLSGPDREAVVARIATTTELRDLAGCDLVIEAVVEDLEAKRALFTELERLVRDDTILATNTSALSVTAIAADVARPERVLGLHFFNPAPVLPLVEVVRAERTSGEVVDAAAEFVRSLGKEPVRCRDTPGFVVNRVLVPLLNDCVRTLDETGVSPEELDTAMRAGASWPIGPCALVDLIGVDVQVRASEALWEALREPRMAPPPKLRRMLDAGELGRKTGRGFYSYE